MRANETYAYFSISDFDCEVEEITRRVEVYPTEFWKKGDVNKNLIQRQSSCWSLYSRLSKLKDLEEHIDDVLSQMDEKPNEFRLLSEEFDGRIQLVGYFYEFYPGLSLDVKLIEKLAFYKSSLDCDFYYLYSNKRENT